MFMAVGLCCIEEQEEKERAVEAVRTSTPGTIRRVGPQSQTRAWQGHARLRGHCKYCAQGGVKTFAGVRVWSGGGNTVTTPGLHRPGGPEPAVGSRLGPGRSAMARDTVSVARRRLRGISRSAAPAKEAEDNSPPASADRRR